MTGRENTHGTSPFRNRVLSAVFMVSADKKIAVASGFIFSVASHRIGSKQKGQNRKLYFLLACINEMKYNDQ